MRKKPIISRLFRFQSPGGQIAAAVENHKIDEVGQLETLPIDNTIMTHN